MAKLVNLEGNLALVFCLTENEMLDDSPERSDFENWIPFTLEVSWPGRHLQIEDRAEAAMTVWELKNWMRRMERVLKDAAGGKAGVCAFDSSEADFSFRLEVVPVDEVMEVEVWVNVGSRTNGALAGYDEGVRFVAEIQAVDGFFRDLQKDLSKIRRKSGKEGP